jgi:hypothetical protein
VKKIRGNNKNLKYIIYNNEKLILEKKMFAISKYKDNLILLKENGAIL